MPTATTACSCGGRNSTACQPRCASQYENGPKIAPSSIASHGRCITDASEWLSVSAKPSHNARIQAGASNVPGHGAA